MREHYLGLVNQLLEVADPDPRRLLDALKRVVDAAGSGRNPLDDGGLVALLASNEQLATIRQVQGLMSLLEGHGDVTMDRAGADSIPSADRFSRVLRQRRQSINPVLKLVLQLVGIEAKLRQYEAGERFVQHVEGEGGPALLDRVWEHPSHLPDVEEIEHPDRWVNRIRTVEPLAG
jgi:putative hydrolase